MGIRWPKVISNTMVWEATGKKPIILQIRMRNWQGIGQTLRKVNESTEKQALIGICKEAEGEEDRRKPGKGPFLRKQENVAKHGARLRGWWATEQMEMFHKCPVFLRNERIYYYYYLLSKILTSTT